MSSWTFVDIRGRACCLRCGALKALPAPRLTEVVIEWMREFERAHEGCRAGVLAEVERDEFGAPRKMHFASQEQA